tara:strand:- start:616 stop:804 length:189 start_codon:yes stop_codon:yes gene_type:complete
MFNKFSNVVGVERNGWDLLGINALIVGDNMLIWCIECDEMFIGVWGDSYCAECWRKMKGMKR